MMVFEDELNEFVEKISRELNPKAIFVFGSVAKGTATQDSDLDLMVVMDTDMTYYERTLAVRKCLGIVRIPVDTLVFTPEEVEEGKMKFGSIISEVLSTGKVVHGAA